MSTKDILAEARRRLLEESDADRVFDELCREYPDLRAEFERLVQELTTHHFHDLAQAPGRVGGESKANLEARSNAEPNKNTQAGADVSSASPQPPRETLPPNILDDGTIHVGDHVAGRYHILERLAVGGMGMVFVAEQRDPVRRRVALKVIKPGMDSQQIIARFALERQVLGLMDHPNIAKVYDGGLTASGRPFFVMEFVRGLPITEFCDREHFDIWQRVQLFIQVCHGVHHAHQKGIIHRDLKPSNVLVTILDGRPVPKVIDFGVAKALNHGLIDETIYTAQHVMIGTLEYVAPEQVISGQIDIDTRADIYSLGVILYQLICGELPLSRQTELRGSLDDVARTIREVVPKRPSHRISEAEKRSKQGNSRSRLQLRRSVSSELDWIVMKCLEKDRDRRYNSATELAADLEAFLNHQPVKAGPPSATYRLKKFLHRHYGKVATALLFLMLLVVSLIISVTGWIRAIRAEREANAEAAVHRALARFISEDLFKKVDTTEQLINGLPSDPNIPLLVVLDRASKQIDSGQLGDQPLVEASLRLTFVRAYLFLGKLDLADHHARRALEIRRQLHGPNHPDTIDALFHLADVHFNADRVADAMSCFEKVIQLEQLRGEDETPLCLRAKHLLLELQSRENPEMPAVVEQLEAIYQKQVQRLGPHHPDTLKTLGTIARKMTETDQFEETEKRLTQLQRTYESVYGPYSGSTVDALNLRANHLVKQGDLIAAEAVYRELLRRATKAFKPDHPIIAVFKHNFAACLALQGEERAEEALALLKSAKPSIEQLPEGHRLRKTFEDTLSQLEKLLSK